MFAKLQLVTLMNVPILLINVTFTKINMFAGL